MLNTNMHGCTTPYIPHNLQFHQRQTPNAPLALSLSLRLFHSAPGFAFFVMVLSRASHACYWACCQMLLQINHPSLQWRLYGETLRHIEEVKLTLDEESPVSAWIAKVQTEEGCSWFSLCSPPINATGATRFQRKPKVLVLCPAVGTHDT